ncbi:protein SIEL isoform X2 [Cucumis melo var. makuwa]|uniref:Protein SIEL isoform X2 n=2 Tax=Cucumis melo TaxID=3656 RepID=A0A5A7SIP6_CUCMM|nr:protein SIEL isoform X2 [Cucumis melo var. makuwa]TYK22848.1 protein SIEL isoform X2 [Cucumis melo var. makuwa]
MDIPSLLVGSCYYKVKIHKVRTNLNQEGINASFDDIGDYFAIFVRLQALETLHHMAKYNCLKLQEAHMHIDSTKNISIAATLLGRISHALGDIMDQSTIFAYLLHNNKHIGLSDLGFNSEEASCSTTRGSSINDIHGIVSLKIPTMIHEQGQKDDDAIESIKTILLKMQDILPLIQSGVLA